jgi:hypothetical protein
MTLCLLVQLHEIQCLTLNVAFAFDNVREDTGQGGFCQRRNRHTDVKLATSLKFHVQWQLVFIYIKLVILDKLWCIPYLQQPEHGHMHHLVPP